MSSENTHTNGSSSNATVAEAPDLSSASGFDPSTFYQITRRPKRRNSLHAVSCDFEVSFGGIETQIDKVKDILNHLKNFLIEELNRENESTNHRIRLVLNAPSLSYPFHIPFQEAADFSIDFVLNEIERVLNSNEGFDISSDMKVNVLSVSLPAMGGYKIGGIHNRTIPDVLTFISQKRSVISIHTNESNNCLLAALGVGMALADNELQQAEKQFSKKKYTGFGKKAVDIQNETVFKFGY